MTKWNPIVEPKRRMIYWIESILYGDDRINKSVWHESIGCTRIWSLAHIHWSLAEKLTRDWIIGLDFVMGNVSRFKWRYVRHEFVPFLLLFFPPHNSWSGEHNCSTKYFLLSFNILFLLPFPIFIQMKTTQIFHGLTEK